jgi:hypothetical protein
MIINRLVGLRWMGLMIAICLIAGACKKAAPISSQAAKQARLEWSLKTLVNAYQDNGDTDPKWDGPAIRALTEFAHARAKVLDADEPVAEIITTNVAAAVQAGCDDPMVNYLYIKYAMSQTNSKEAYLNAFMKAARNMDQSIYPPIRKFYVDARTLDQIFYTYGTNAPQQPAESEIFPLLKNSLNTTLEDKNMPAEEAYEAASLYLSLLKGNNDFYQQAYDKIEKPLFQNWPDAATSWLLKGEAYYQMAWQARGGGYADGVSAESWKPFFQQLATAETATKKAWDRDPTDTRIPTFMIQIDEGLQRDRQEMELWFSRAMQTDPNNYEACEHKLHYLYPQWYGSQDDMITFGRECVATTNWGGNVPLILADSHREYWLYLNDSEEKSNYWKSPDVWPDIQAAFDRFFELNPDATGYYHNYAWYAYHAEQWNKLNELLPKLGPVNYDYFGGKDEFNKMVQLAKEHAGDSKSPQ